jgi:hypothetical protein
MTGFNPMQKTGYGSALPQPGTAVPSAGQPGHGFFHDLLDIVNPLQHVPVVSTIYRAITGEHIGTFEKIAGDTLYGGIWGAASSVADTAFEAITGKDFGSTVLAMFTGGHGQKSPQVAANTPSAVVAPAPDLTALSNALAAKGVDSDLARRAMFAYQRSDALPNATLIN